MTVGVDAGPSPVTQPGRAGQPAGGLQQRVAAVAREIARGAGDRDREARFPADAIALLWRSGLGNLTLAAARGGDGLPLTSVARIVRCIGAADASVALIWVMHLIHLALVADDTFGLAPGVQDAIVRSSLQGPALINALRVEPELGTPSRGGAPATVARRKGRAGAQAGWSLNGHKIYCTGSHGLRWMLVWASVAGEGETRTGPFVVDAETPGIEIRETWDHLGMRASASHDVIFTDVTIAEDRVGNLEVAGAQGSAGRDPVAIAAMSLLLGSLYFGIAQAARDRLLVYLDQRIPTTLGAPLASLPRFQMAVGEIETALLVAGRLLDGLAEDLTAGADRARAGAATAGPIKTVVTRSVISVTEQAVALIGNPGLSYHLPLQRHLRDALCSRIHTPQDDSILLATGRAALQQARGGD